MHEVKARGGFTEMNDFLRARIREHPDKSQLAVDVGIRYHRLTYFARTPGSVLQTEDLERLMAYYGLEVNVDLPAVPAPVFDWIVHPDNPAYEYEVGEDRKPTGQVRRRELVKPVAAE